jgi:hypothetical protein
MELQPAYCHSRASGNPNRGKTCLTARFRGHETLMLKKRETKWLLSL